jgi:hypothetical protein
MRTELYIGDPVQCSMLFRSHCCALLWSELACATLRNRCSTDPLACRCARAIKESKGTRARHAQSTPCWQNHVSSARTLAVALSDSYTRTTRRHVRCVRTDTPGFRVPLEPPKPPTYGALLVTVLDGLLSLCPLSSLTYMPVVMRHSIESAATSTRAPRPSALESQDGFRCRKTRKRRKPST